MLHLRYSAALWISWDFRIYQSYEYTRVLNMSGLRKVLNKIFHDRCLAVLWICIVFWMCQGFKYARITVHHTCLTEFWVFLGSSVCWGLNIQGLWIWQCYTGFCVNCILKIQGILNVLSSEYPESRFWMYLESKYVIVTKGAEWSASSCTCQGSLRKHYIKDAWQGSEYSSGFEYTRILNMPMLHKVLKKMLHQRCLTGFGIFLRLWIW